MKLNSKTTKRFGPWALVTGASSGIGAQFARQLASSGLNIVLAARRGPLLDQIGSELARSFGVQTRSVVIDLSEEGFIEKLRDAVNDLDIGLVISNAGTGNPGSFLAQCVSEALLALQKNQSLCLPGANNRIMSAPHRSRNQRMS